MTDKIKGRGGRRPGSGRKPLPTSEKRNRKIMVTVTESEHRELQREAGDQPLGSFIYELVKRSLARRRKG